MNKTATEWDVLQAIADSPWERAQAAEAVPVAIPDPEEISEAFDVILGVVDAPTERYVRVTTDLTWKMEVR